VTETSVEETPASSIEGKKHYRALLIALAAWIVPGAGHLLLGRWGRAVLFFLVVGGLAFTGFLLRGQVFPPHSDDPFGTLGFLADACSGVFFVLAHLVEKAGPDLSRAAGDYGTRFVAAAGLVNVLSVVDAYGIAVGRRP
jgi:predicted membrane channel-forming protein YqfA (hemolysin III family)